ncbi:MAG: hypothetical protein ACYDG2_21140 [Ruminiclostridium sp.]
MLLLQIHHLLVFIAKNIPLRSSKYDFKSPKYSKYNIDKAPIIKHFERLDYKQILSEYHFSIGKELKPINSRGKNPVPATFTCPRCGAPHNYLYDNTGGRGQLLCKVCDFRFNKQKAEFEPVVFICPYCGHALELKKTRKHFNVHKCVNKKCSFYLQNLKNLLPEDLAEYDDEKSRFKLHYIYREFTFDFFKIDLSSIPDKLFSMSFRNFSPHIMGLCLTYHVNLGLSSRKTAQALYDIH